MNINLPVPEWFDAKKIVAEFVGGKDLLSISKSYGVSVAELTHHLTQHSPEDWKQAQALRQLRRMEEAEDAIDAAAEGGDYQKARANEIKLRSAQWAVERVLRRIYGEPKDAPTQTQVLVRVDLVRRRDRQDREPIEGEPQALAVTQTNAVKVEDAEVIKETPKKAKKAAPAQQPPQKLIYPDAGIV